MATSHASVSRALRSLGGQANQALYVGRQSLDSKGKGKSNRRWQPRRGRAETIHVPLRAGPDARLSHHYDNIKTPERIRNSTQHATYIMRISIQNKGKPTTDITSIS